MEKKLVWKEVCLGNILLFLWFDNKNTKQTNKQTKIVTEVFQDFLNQFLS